MENKVPTPEAMKKAERIVTEFGVSPDRHDRKEAVDFIAAALEAYSQDQHDRIRIRHAKALVVAVMAETERCAKIAEDHERILLFTRKNIHLRNKVVEIRKQMGKEIAKRIRSLE